MVEIRPLPACMGHALALPGSTHGSLKFFWSNFRQVTARQPNLPSCHPYVTPPDHVPSVDTTETFDKLP